MLDDLSGVERHEQALARALGVPDHADFAVAVGPRGGERTGYRLPHSMKLVITGKNLGNATASVTEDDEILYQIEEAAFLENAFEDRFQFGRAFGRKVIARDRAPGHEAFAIGCERADA